MKSRISAVYDQKTPQSFTKYFILIYEIKSRRTFCGKSDGCFHLIFLVLRPNPFFWKRDLALD